MTVPPTLSGTATLDLMPGPCSTAFLPAAADNSSG